MAAFWDGSFNPWITSSQFNTISVNMADIDALNGNSAPEIRKWRFNLITNYKFQEGKLEGLGIGGAIRWEDKFIIDYERSFVNNFPVIDLTKPIYDGEQTTYDLWASYTVRKTDNYEWNVQLNIYNVFGSDELQAIRVNNDGSVSPGTFRIREGRSWALTNTIKF